MQFQYRADQSEANEMVRRLGLSTEVTVEGRNAEFASKGVSGKLHYESNLRIMYVTVTAHTPPATETMLRKYFDKLFSLI